MKAEDIIRAIKDYVTDDGNVQMKMLESLNKESTAYWDVNWFMEMENGVELRTELMDDPQEFLKCLEIGIKESVSDSYSGEHIQVRLEGLQTGASHHKSIQELRSKELNTLMVIEGLVKSKTDAIPEIQVIKWECNMCGNIINILRSETDIKKPTKCGCGCKGFAELSREMADKIIITLEESHEDTSGTEMKKLKMIFRGSLASSLMDIRMIRGSRIRITGILKGETKINPKTGVIKVDMATYLEVNNVEFLQDEYKEIIVTPEDRVKVLELDGDGDRIKFWADNMFSHLHGYAEVKEAIICQLVGADKIKKHTKTTRGTIHILLLGDPGIGKSTFLKMVQKMALKSRYASGKSTSAVGITANVAKDETIGSWVVEAGAFPLSHNGILCLDEFDKISNEDKSALHEGMEQQTVTVNKANVHATLVAETSLLAAANPKKGRFNLHMEMYEQFDLQPTLVNRFDLIFLFIDKPTAKIDEKISEKIIESFTDVEEKEKEISVELFKKYLLMAKEIKPKLEKETVEKAKQMYMNIRKKITEHEGINIPISPRALESSIRLSVAHAKARLSNKVEKVDVEWAINMMLFALGKISIDLITGEIDVDQIETGVSGGKKKLDDEIEQFIKSKENNEVDEQEIIDIFKGKVTERQIEKVMNDMRKRGDFFEPRRGIIKWLE